MFELGQKDIKLAKDRLKDSARNSCREYLDSMDSI